MPAASHLPHIIGTIGELLNFTGALVLARDLFVRQREHKEAKRLRARHEWGRAHSISAKFQGVPINDPDFVEKVQGQRTSRLGYIGVGFMAAGFLCLAGYHVFSIYLESTISEQGRMGLTGISEIPIILLGSLLCALSQRES
jgi:hypothetical protein